MKFAVIAALFLFSAVCIIKAEDADKKDPPQGMQIIKVGDGQNIIVPQGTKIRKVGAQLIMEDNSEYTARRLSDIEARLDRIEKNEEELKQEIGLIKSKLEEKESAKD